MFIKMIIISTDDRRQHILMHCIVTMTWSQLARYALRIYLMYDIRKLFAFCKHSKLITNIE